MVQQGIPSQAIHVGVLRRHVPPERGEGADPDGPRAGQGSGRTGSHVEGRCGASWRRENEGRIEAIERDFENMIVRDLRFRTKLCELLAQLLDKPDLPELAYHERIIEEIEDSLAARVRS